MSGLIKRQRIAVPKQGSSIYEQMKASGKLEPRDELHQLPYRPLLSKLSKKPVRGGVAGHPLDVGGESVTEPTPVASVGDDSRELERGSLVADDPRDGGDAEHLLGEPESIRPTPGPVEAPKRRPGLFGIGRFGL